MGYTKLNYVSVHGFAVYQKKESKRKVLESVEFHLDATKIVQCRDNPAVNQRMAKDLGANLKMLTGGKEMMMKFGACSLFPVNSSQFTPYLPYFLIKHI